MNRIVQSELLDHLHPADPRALRSRRDLRVINRWMRNDYYLRLELSRLPPPRRILELGAGDGTLLARLIPSLVKLWGSPPNVFLLDRAPAVTPETVAAFNSHGCEVNIVAEDLHRWLRSNVESFDVVIANLFLHHFEPPELAKIFAALSTKTTCFICCEPRRWWPAIVATRLLFLLGCNHITRHDAVISVRAGFSNQELSALWPAATGFTLLETPAGYASHLFVARASNSISDSPRHSAVAASPVATPPPLR